MPTDDERRKVARNIRENYSRSGLGCKVASTYNIALAVGIVPEIIVGDVELWNRLADLIEPSCDPTGRGIDSIYDWCWERLEGADGAEDELYCSIMRAIDDYRHPERATAHTVRAVDRDALLAPAEEMVEMFRLGAFTGEGIDAKWCRELHGKYTRRIREALGVES